MIKNFIFHTLAVILVIQVVSCSDDSNIDYKPITLSDEYTFSGDPQVFFPETSGYVDLTYNLEIGSTPVDVFFILTNKSLDVSVASHDVSSENISSDPYLQSIEPSLNSPKVEGSPAQRGTPTISEFNRTPFALKDAKRQHSPLAMSYIATQEPVFAIQPASDDEVSDSQDFIIDDTMTTVPATCRYVQDNISTKFGLKKLNIWVADDCWTIGGTKSHLVNSTMVTALAAEFLDNTSTDDDIYDWVTGIYGEEWGTHSYTSQLILPDDNISILLFDIEADDDQNFTTGFVAGYFYSKDNFLSEQLDYSNERIMFYLDAVAYACQDGALPATWSITDTRPRDIVMTLAHELQHMIHFYQKNIKLTEAGTGTDVWINEMCSLATEDLICSLLGSSFTGPRGISGTEPGPGSEHNTQGWLPYFVNDPDSSLSIWNEEDLALDYATAYTFGAYLARNYGGAALLKNIVQNEYTDSRAITEGIELAGGQALTFETLLRSWGAAVLLSEYTDLDETDYSGLIYNRGNTFYTTTTSIDSTVYTYDLGSINVFNYDDGLLIYNPTAISTGGDLQPGSNRYSRIEAGATGSRTWEIRLEKNSRLTVVIKP